MKQVLLKNVPSGCQFIFAARRYVKLKEPYIRILGRTYNTVRLGFFAGEFVDFKDDDVVMVEDKDELG